MLPSVTRVFERIAAPVIAFGLQRFFLSPPRFVLTEEKRADFAALWEQARESGGTALKYELPYPRWEFLRYLAEHEDVLFRGMPGEPLGVLEPTENTDAKQRQVRAVFASGDPVWPLFFGTLQLRGVDVPISMRNGALVVGRGTGVGRCYWFSLNREFGAAEPWTDGTVYLLSREGFRPVTQGLLRFDEWLHEGEVRPIATLAISRDDFPFAQRVATHERREPMWKTLLLYRWRTRRRP